MIAEKEKTKIDSFFARVLSNRSQAETIREAESMSLIHKLNRMIERGASFDVGADKFDTFGTVKESDKDFLSINRDSILCTLQQSLLVKYLFKNSKNALDEFSFEVAEHQKIIAGQSSAELPDVYFQVVSEISKKWFAKLIESI